LQADTTSNVSYTFRKTFTWLGPIVGATLNLGAAADNGYEVRLNGNLVGSDPTEFNYTLAGQDTYSSFSSFIVQGVNTLEITVSNKAQVNGTPETNPGGLLYRLHIDGNCEGDYFKTHCTLFSEKDLGADDHFWQFNDVKPGDYGTNVISLHPLGNDAFACLFSNNLVDSENDLLSLETLAGDSGSPVGELSSLLKLFAWADDGDGVYESGEATLVPFNTPINTEAVTLALSSASVTNVGIAWCAGVQNVVSTTISCDGSGDNNIAQTDSSTLDMTAYAVQQRHNEALNCATIAGTYRNPQTPPPTNPNPIE
jgi:hypothetical protein